jgi:quinolinate synthase
MVESINAKVPLAEARATLAAAYDLKFTKAVAKVTERVHERLKRHVSDDDWRTMAPLIVQIGRQKFEKRAAILADYHQPPEVFWGVADVTGDQLSLIKSGMASRRQVIVVAGLHTLAENIALLRPRSKVISPDSRARSPLTGAITRADLEAIRGQYPGTPVLAHVNASLAVKAAAQSIFTATNAEAVLAATAGDKVIVVPDQFLAQRVARSSSKKIVAWAGRSAEYGNVTADEVAALREAHPDAAILGHPSNPPDVAAAADFSGSPEKLAGWLGENKPPVAILLGGKPLAVNLAASVPGTTVVAANGIDIAGPRIGLESILWALHTLTEPVELDAALIEPARAALTRMLEITRRN